MNSTAEFRQEAPASFRFSGYKSKASPKVYADCNVTAEEIIVVYDDLDIEPGIVKIRKKGGAGTHNGMKSVVSEIKTEDFCRIRIGIGNPTYKNDLLNFILNKIPDEEYKVLQDAQDSACKAVIEILKNGIDSAMNKYN